MIAQGDLHSLELALKLYRLDTGAYPTTEQGLQALRVKPADVNQWNGPYLPKEIPPDPWGHLYIYKFPGEHGDVGRSAPVHGVEDRVDVTEQRNARVGEQLGRLWVFGAGAGQACAGNLETGVAVAV